MVPGLDDRDRHEGLTASEALEAVYLERIRSEWVAHRRAHVLRRLFRRLLREEIGPPYTEAEASLLGLVEARVDGTRARVRHEVDRLRRYRDAF